MTSPPGIGTTIVGSLRGDAEFALANPLGGIGFGGVAIPVVHVGAVVPIVLGRG